MGCSASRPDILLIKAVEGSASYLSSSRSNPLFADSSMAPSPSPSVPIARSLTAPLVHHLSTWEGVTHHLVSLTSTTYGSLILVDRRPSAAGEFDARDYADQSHSWKAHEIAEEWSSNLVSPNSRMNSVSPDSRMNSHKNPNSRMNSVSPDSISNKLSDSFVFVEKPHEIAEEWSSNLQNTSSPLLVSRFSSVTMP